MLALDGKTLLSSPLGPGPLGSPDHLGVFSGATVEDGYNGFPTSMYTSVQHLPISWDIPYQPQSETQSIAYTPDHGMTWIKYEGNPVIPHPPADLNVTGWRDPLVFRDANLAASLVDPSDQIYTTVSSGERPTSGGRLLLYRAQNSNMTRFDLIGYLFQAAGNSSWSEFSGSYGFNFEMGGYRTLHQGRTAVERHLIRNRRRSDDTWKPLATLDGWHGRFLGGAYPQHVWSLGLG
jgi:beta-fructofuranosidase